MEATGVFWKPVWDDGGERDLRVVDYEPMGAGFVGHPVLGGSEVCSDRLPGGIVAGRDAEGLGRRRR
jgi:hypothetical protein